MQRAPMRRVGDAALDRSLREAVQDRQRESVVQHKLAVNSADIDPNQPLRYKSGDLDYEDYYVPQPCCCCHGTTADTTSRLFGVALPVALGYLSTAAMTVTDMAFVGHLGTEELAAMTLSNVVIMGTLAVAIGAMASLGPLCSQAFAAGQYKRVSAWLQVATMWPVLLFGPILAAAWMYSGTILELAGAGSSPRVTALADEFGRWSLLWLVPAIVFNGLSVWLECMDIVWPTTVLSVVFVGVNIALNWIFVAGMGGLLSNWQGFGLIGSPIATSVGKVLQLLTLWLWAFVFGKSHRPHRAWQGWSCAAMDMRFVSVFLRLGAPTALVETVFDWSFEILTAFGGMWAAHDTATMGILVGLYFLFQPIQTGLLSSVGINVGSRLAQGDAESAARISRIGTLWNVCIAIAAAGVLAVISPWVGMLFSTDLAVLNAVSAATPIVALTVGITSVSSASQGVMDGQKRGDLVTYATLGSTWMLGLPLAWVLGEALDLGVAGLWWGFLAGECVRSCLLLIMAVRTIWEEEVSRMERVMEDEYEDDEQVEIALGDAGIDDMDNDDEDMGDFIDVEQHLVGSGDGRFTSRAVP